MHQPLDGLTILVTRPEKQAAGLIKRLHEQGASVIHQPAIEITSIDIANLHHLPASLTDYDWLIFISQNAVEYGLPHLSAIQTGRPSICAIGKATKKALNDNGYTNVFCPDAGYSSEDLAASDAFSARNIGNKNVLIIRGGEGRDYLKQVLEERHAKVDYLDVYQRQAAKIVITAEQLQQLNCITVSSQQGLENLVSMFEPMTAELLFDKLLIVPSDRCRARATELGFKQVETAANATDDAMLKCIIDNIRA